MFQHLSQYTEELEKILHSRGLTPELPIISLPKLNNKVWGLHSKKVLVLGARTSHGKSSLALQLSFDMAKQGKPVAFISLEMSCEDMLERLFCNVYSVDNYELLTGHINRYQNEFDEFKEKLHGIPMGITDCMGKTWKEIDTLINELTTKPKVVVVDYIQAIKGVNAEMKGSIDEYIKHFREMARKYNFAGILCSQINRASQEDKSKEPRLHHLKGSGGLEEISDQIMLLHWPYKYNEKADMNRFFLFLAKNRSGRTGYVQLKYLPQYYRFEEAEETPTQNWQEKEE